MISCRTNANLKSLVLGAFVVLSLSLACMAGAFADQLDPRLPKLFDRLRSSEQPGEARAIEMAIWEIWNESGESDLDALLRAGESAMALEDFVAAKDNFDAVIKARPNFAEAWNKRATLFYLAGAFPESLQDIERVLELEPRHFGALSGLGLVNLALSREQAALDAFERVLSLYPANEAARQNADFIEKKMRENDI
jgi:tetratricopeptide (TPR) repeat protein